jgi:hypothetical protein
VAASEADERARALRMAPGCGQPPTALAHEETEGFAWCATRQSPCSGIGIFAFEDVARFDPARHEAVASVDSDAAAGTIVGVVHPGYGSPDFVLRPASVVVSGGRG